MNSDNRPTWKKLRDMFNDQVRKPNLWDNARFILADVPLDRAAVKRILPLGVWPSEPALGTLFIADYPTTSFTVPYKEAALLVHVRTLLGPGVHCPWMVVDDDTAMIYGRELLGYPKKMAALEFEEDGDRVRGSVTRRGVTVLTMEGVRGQAQSRPAPVFDRKTFNFGGLGQFFAVSPLWLFRPRETIHESDEAAVVARVSESEFDPIAGLVSGPAANGRLVTMDIPGSRYNVIVGLAGLRSFANSYYLRYR